MLTQEKIEGKNCVSRKRPTTLHRSDVKDGYRGYAEIQRLSQKRDAWRSASNWRPASD